MMCRSQVKTISTTLALAMAMLQDQQQQQPVVGMRMFGKSGDDDDSFRDGDKNAKGWGFNRLWPWANQGEEQQRQEVVHVKDLEVPLKG